MRSSSISSSTSLTKGLKHIMEIHKEKDIRKSRMITMYAAVSEFIVYEKRLTSFLPHQAVTIASDSEVIFKSQPSLACSKSGLKLN